MANQKFNPLALEQLINDCTSDVDQISSELATYNNSEVVPAGNPATSNLINQSGAAVDFTRVYRQIQRLIQNGNNALQVLASVDPDVTNTQTLHATASLMTAIKNCIAQFTKIHAIHLKHQLHLQQQQIRQKHRLQLLNARNQLKQKKTDEVPTESVQLKQFSDATTADIFRFLQQEKEKRDAQK